MPTNFDGYEPLFEFLDQVISRSPNATKIHFTSKSACTSFLHKLNRARRADLERSRITRTPDDPNYNTSPYSAISVRRPNEQTLIISPTILLDGVDSIEEIPPQKK